MSCHEVLRSRETVHLPKFACIHLCLSLLPELGLMEFGALSSNAAVLHFALVSKSKQKSQYTYLGVWQKGGRGIEGIVSLTATGCVPSPHHKSLMQGT